MKRLLLVLSCAAVAACTSAPYRRPAIDIPDRWSTPTAAGQILVERDWWRRFDDATLNGLVDESLAGNFDVIAAGERLEQARATGRIASSALFPALAAGASLERLRGKGTQTQELFLQASYEIDLWGRLRSSARAADALATASSFDRDTVRLTIAASVVNAYFQVASLRERVRLARAITSDARHLLSLVEAQVAGGIASKLELEQQRNAVATFDAAGGLLRQQLEQSLHALAVLVRRNPQGFEVEAVDLLAVAIPQGRADLPARLLEQRPDIRAAEARIVAAHYDVAAARAAFFPDVTFSAQAGLANGALAHFFPATTVTSLALGIVQPLFEGGRLDGQLAFTNARQRELVADYQRTILVAFQDVEDVFSSVRQLQRVEDSDRIAVESARAAEELAEARFKYGTVTFVTVLDSQRTRYQAEDAALQVRLARLQASVGLFRALGGGFGIEPDDGGARS